MSVTAGQRFRQALADESPLQLVGAVNAYCAKLAKSSGFQAIYLSGAGVANASYGLPDLGMTNLTDVLTDVSRITAACDLPLIVDVDTGWGDALGIARTMKSLIQAGAAGMHIEDQVSQKRCGHRPNKAMVSTHEMGDRLKASLDARHDASFYLIARSDAYANEGMNGLIERACAYAEIGADAIFAEALPNLEIIGQVCRAVPIPVLVNMTEFGKTPLLTREQLKNAGVNIILYPLTAFRAMSFAAKLSYETLRQHGDQQPILQQMQTRDDLYQELDYHHYEAIMDSLLNKEKEP